MAPVIRKATGATCCRSLARQLPKAIPIKLQNQPTRNKKVATFEVATVIRAGEFILMANSFVGQTVESANRFLI